VHPSRIGQTLEAGFTGQHHADLGRINTQKAEPEAVVEPDIDSISVVGFYPDPFFIFRKVGQRALPMRIPPCRTASDFAAFIVRF
jgi:hypothetical protein